MPQEEGNLIIERKYMNLETHSTKFKRANTSSIKQNIYLFGSVPTFSPDFAAFGHFLKTFSASSVPAQCGSFYREVTG